jgi:predicted permease
VPLHEQAVAPVQSVLWLLLASVGVVLLIACVNVANLMLARGVARQQELAMRAALGASRGRLVQQVLVESFVLSAIGAAAGFLLARWITPVLVRWAPRGTPRLDEVAADGTVLLFTLAVAAACGAVVGLVPALGVSRTPVREAIGNGVRATADSRRRLRDGLVAAQVGLAVVLTVGSGLLVRSFVAVLDVDPGFRTDRLLTLAINAPPEYDTPDARLALYERLFARLEAVPGVVAAGGTTRLPLGGANSTTTVAVEGRIPADGQWPELDFRRAVHRYFETIALPLRRGRYFTDADRADAPPVVILNESAARRLFGTEDPLGQTLRLGSSSPVRRATVIGVVGDLRHERLDIPPASEVYVYYRQAVPVAPLLVVRTTASPVEMAATIRSAIREVDASILPANVRTMESLRSASVSGRVFLLGLVSSFGALALLLAAVGVYGVISLVVAERRREMGIRLALGASARGLVRMVVAQALRLTLAGIVAGIVLAGLLTPLVASQLFGVTALDPATFGGVALLLLAVALAAAAVPAGRVLRVDPAMTLRD